MMSKLDLLRLLARREDLDAASVAHELGGTRAAAGMLLLRHTRHGLIQRALDPDDRVLFYNVTEKGQARLAYLTKMAKAR
jgi:DNA-binding MarR family transcriptional regulator